LAQRIGGEPGLSREEVARLTRLLHRLDFEVAVTTPTEMFVSNRLLVGFLTPLVRFIELEGDARVINGALRAAGFVQRPHDLLAVLDRRLVADQLAVNFGGAAQIEPLLEALEDAECRDGKGAALVVDALCVALVDAVLRTRAEVRDVSIVDLIARELLDFPRHLTSMCSWLKRGRVAQAVAGDPRVRALVSDAAFESARAFAAGTREFYR